MLSDTEEAEALYERQSTGFFRLGCDSTLPVLDCCTESGWGDSTGGETLGISYAAPTDCFSQFGMSGFAGRAAAELLATGERFASVRSTLEVT